MHDDIVEHGLRGADQAPVERQHTSVGARAPARTLVANRQRAVRDVQALRLTPQHALDLDARLLAVPRVDRRDVWKRKREAADPDDVVALQTECELLGRLCELALEPGTMLEQQRLDRGLRRAGRHDDLGVPHRVDDDLRTLDAPRYANGRSEEHTSELQSRGHLVCRLLLEKKKSKNM